MSGSGDFSPANTLHFNLIGEIDKSVDDIAKK